MCPHSNLNVSDTGFDILIRLTILFLVSSILFVFPSVSVSERQWTTLAGSGSCNRPVSRVQEERNFTAFHSQGATTTLLSLLQRDKFLRSHKRRKEKIGDSCSGANSKSMVDAFVVAVVILVVGAVVVVVVVVAVALVVVIGVAVVV